MHELVRVALQRGNLPAFARELGPLAWCVDEVRGPVATWHLLQCRAVLAQAQARFADARLFADRAVRTLTPSTTGYESAVINRTGVLSGVGLHTGTGLDTTGLLAAGTVLGAPDAELDFVTEGVIFSVAAARLLVVAGRRLDASGSTADSGTPGHLETHSARDHGVLRVRD